VSEQAASPEAESLEIIVRRPIDATWCTSWPLRDDGTRQAYTAADFERAAIYLMRSVHLRGLQIAAVNEPWRCLSRVPCCLVEHPETSIALLAGSRMCDSAGHTLGR
jgi:hypothetical protein